MNIKGLGNKSTQVGSAVSEIYAKFTITENPKNKGVQKRIKKQQESILEQEKKIAEQEELNKIRRKKSVYVKKREAIAMDRSIRSLKAKKLNLRRLRAEMRKNTKVRDENTLSLHNEKIAMAKTRVATLGWTAALVAATKTMTVGFRENINYIENLNVVQEMFGDNTDAVIKWAQSMRSSFGLARNSALKYIGTAKSFLMASGFEKKWGTGASTKVAGISVQLASDLASFRNTSFDTAFRAISSGLAGISRTLRYNFGVDIGDEALKERFGETGTTQAEKIMFRFVKLLESTGFVGGDFKRTKHSPANQLKMLKENFKEYAMEFTEKLIPVVNMSLIILNSILYFITKTWKVISLILIALTVFNIGRAISKLFTTGSGAFLSVLTGGATSTVGQVGVIGAQVAILLGALGWVFGKKKEDVVKPSDGSKTYIDDVLEDFSPGGGSKEIGGTDNSINIQIAGNATEASISDAIFQMKQEQFRRG